MNKMEPTRAQSKAAGLKFRKSHSLMGVFGINLEDRIPKIIDPAMLKNIFATTVPEFVKKIPTVLPSNPPIKIHKIKFIHKV